VKRIQMKDMYIQRVVLEKNNIYRLKTMSVVQQCKQTGLLSIVMQVCCSTLIINCVISAVTQIVDPQALHS
jgi:hypothetical protein